MRRQVQLFVLDRMLAFVSWTIHRVIHFELGVERIEDRLEARYRRLQVRS